MPTPAQSTGMATASGKFRYKYSMRAVFRAVSLVSLIAAFSAYNYYTKDGIIDTGRRLSEIDRNLAVFQDKADPTWLIAVYATGILYLFLALAIVCDEYFVPALEEMSGENQLNLSLDVAGATLMAAGGSAPELFTSLFGTFSESSVGFGTIVGSAVFNVLFVIGMCSLLSKEVLQLTWWPLFRDSTYYAISLLVLAIFVGVNSKEIIELWEAIVLFVMYFGYVGVMYFNESLYMLLSGKELYPDEEEDSSEETFISFKYHTTFRAGLLTLIRDPESWLDKARVGFVSKIAGNVDEVFAFVDQNGDGTITRTEVRECFNKLEDNDNVSETELDMIMEDLDKNRNGFVTKSEFKTWYLHSEGHVTSQIRKVFDKFDSDMSGKVNRLELSEMLKEIEPSVSDHQLEEAVNECYTGSETDISFEEFTKWYLKSTYYKRQQRKAQDADEEDERTLCQIISPPTGASFFGIIKYIVLFPLVFTLALTVPDVRRKSVDGKYCYVAFIMAIAWIGFYSYFMVGWAETIGATLGIPSYIMGLTFLAAGTSVPDLISSVIVARMGEGDMAVSSSIGSNIFDILIGLPLPWIIYIAWPSTKSEVYIAADGVWLSIMILLGMLVLIIVTIHFQKWRLTKKLGFVMFFFYVVFLAQALLREYL